MRINDIVTLQTGRPYYGPDSGRARRGKVADGTDGAGGPAPRDRTDGRIPTDGTPRVRTRMGVGTPPAPRGTGSAEPASAGSENPATATGLDPRLLGKRADEGAQPDPGPMALVERFMRERSVLSVQLPFDGPAGKGVLNLYYEVESAYRVVQLVPAASLVDAEA